MMALCMALAGCTDSVEDDLKNLVDLPGCEDNTALNYDENATNSDACLTEIALETSILDFISLMENGPTDMNNSFGVTIVAKM